MWVHFAMSGGSLCVCGRSARFPQCDNSHVTEDWTCARESTYAELGFLASDRYQNLARKLASQHRGALCLPGERDRWPALGTLVVLVDGSDLDFPLQASLELNARARLLVTLGVTGSVLAPLFPGARVLDLSEASPLQAFREVTAALRKESPGQVVTGAALRSAFLSHAVKDEALILPVATWIRERFHADLFLCADSIPLGSTWHEVILGALRAKDRFVYLLSEASLASHFCAFEVGAAVALEKPIALLSLDGCRPAAFAQHLQAVDLPRLLRQRPWLEAADILTEALLQALV